MREGKTSTGFEFKFDESRLNNMRLVDAFAEFSNTAESEFSRMSAFSKVITLLLGADEKERLYDHIASYSDGLVPADALEKELKEILAAEPGNTVKN